MPHDAADAKGVLEDIDGLADMVAVIAGSEDVIHNHIIGPLKGVAREEDKGTQRVEAGIVDAPDVFHGSPHRQLHDDGRGDLDMRQLRQQVGDFGWDRRAAKSSEKAGIGWTDDHIGAAAVGACPGVIEMEMIMTISIAPAASLKIVRKVRCSKFTKISLFMVSFSR